MNRLFLKIAKEVLQKEIQKEDADLLASKTEIWEEIVKYIKKIKNLDKKVSYSENLLDFARKKNLMRVQALLLFEIAIVLEKQNHIERALSCLEEAYKLLENEESISETKDILSKIANLLQKQGEFIKALEYFELAKKLENRNSPKISEKKITGKAALVTKQISETIHSYEQSLLEALKDLETARKEQKALEERKLLFKIGNLYQNLKKEEEAIRCWKDSLLLSQKKQDFELCFQNSLCLGRILSERKDFVQAKEALIQGISCMEECKVTLGTLSYAFIRDHFTIFQAIIDCCLSQGNTLGTLHFLEQSLRWFYFSRVDESILLNKADIPKELAQEYLCALKTCQESSKVGLSIEEEKKQIHDLRLQIELIDPAWANFWGHQYTLDLPLLQKNLSKRTVLLEFLATESKTLVFLIDSCHFETLVFSNLKYQDLLDLYEPMLQSRHLHRSHAMEICRKQMQKILGKISEAAGRKILEVLENWEADRLVLIPCYTFQLFPLHLLPLSDQQKTGLVWQDRYETVYAPSLSWFIKNMNQKEQNPEGKIAAFSHPGKEHKFFQEEAAMIESLCLERMLSEKQPLWKNVQEKLYQASHIHLGLYASLCYPDSFLSRLSFMQDRKESVESIYPHQVLSENLSYVSMLTLSAVELQFQDWESPADSMGLFVSFLYAGAKKIITNLWPVPDCVSYFILEKFYQGLMQGLPPVMALQESQKEIRQITVTDLRRKLVSLKRFLPEKEAKWVQELSDFLEYSNKDFPMEKRRQILKNLWIPREMVSSGLEDARACSSLSESEENTIGGEVLDPQKKLFADPYYWGSFVCIGMGLTQEILQEEDENFDSVHIEEAAFSDSEKNTGQDIQDILSSLSPATASDIIEAEKEEKDSQKIRDKSQYRIKGRCSYCGKKIRCQLSSEGSKVRCPHCKKKIWIPIQSSPFDDIKIPAVCPYCTKRIHCLLTMAGSRGKCPKCNKYIRIPKRDVLLVEIASGDPKNPVLLLKEKKNNA